MEDVSLGREHEKLHKSRSLCWGVLASVGQMKISRRVGLLPTYNRKKNISV